MVMGGAMTTMKMDGAILGGMMMDGVIRSSQDKVQESTTLEVDIRVSNLATQVALFHKMFKLLECSCWEDAMHSLSRGIRYFAFVCGGMRILL